MSEQVSRLIVVVEDRDAKAHLAKLQRDLQNLKTQAEKAFSSLDKSTKAISTLAQKHTTALKGFNTQLERAAKNAKKLEIGSLAGDMDKVAKASKSFLSSLSHKAIHAFSGAIEGLVQHLSYLGMALGYLGARSLISFGKAVMDAGIYYQKFVSTVQVTTGDLASARQEWEYLMEFATYAGSSIEALADPYAKLAAAAKGTALEGSNLREVFEAISMASTVLHSSVQDTNLMFYAVQQMASKGVVSMEELRRQLGERLPGAMVLAAKAMGLTQKQLIDLVSSGKLLSEDLLPLLAREIKRQFAGGFEYAMNSAQAAMNRLANAWLQTKQIIAESGFLDALVVAFETLVVKLNEAKPALAELGVKLGDIVLNFSDFISELDGARVAQGFSKFLGWVADATKEIVNFIAMLVGVQTALLGMAAAKGNLLSMAAGGAIGGGAGYLGVKAMGDDIVESIRGTQARITDEANSGAKARTAIALSEVQKEKAIRNDMMKFSASLYDMEKARLEDLQKQYGTMYARMANDPNKAKETKWYQDHLEQINKEIVARKKADEIRGKYGAFFNGTGGGSNGRSGPSEADQEAERRLKEFQRMQEEQERLVEQMKRDAVSVSQSWLDEVFPAKAVARKMQEMRDALNWRVAMGDLTSGEAAHALAEFTKQFDASRLGQYNAQLAELNKRWKAGEMNLDEYRLRLLGIKSAYQDLFSQTENISNGTKMALGEIVEDTGNMFQHAYDLSKVFFDGLEDLLVDFFTTGKLNVDDFAKYLHEEITRALVQATIIKPLAQNAEKWVTGIIDVMMSAKGNAFNPQGHVKALATGGVVSGATPFLYNGGMGVMGEAGPEAVMPLKRTSDGKLGVVAEGGGGGAVNVNVTYNLSNGSQLDRRTAQQTAALTAKALSRANQRNN